MKAIMMTVRLWWFYLTYKGIKTIEIRKRFTKDFKGKIFEYVSKTNWKKDLMKIPEEEREFFKQFVGKVGLCFECDKVEEINHWNTFLFTKKSCLTLKEIDKYLGDDDYVIDFRDEDDTIGYAIHITKLEIFDKPKELSEFKRNSGRIGLRGTENGNELFNILKPVEHAPQSWCYIEV